MKKQFILNLLLNLGIIFLVMSGISAYQSGNMLILGLAIAISVVLIYLKVVLLKHVKSDFRKKQEEKFASQKKNKKG
jgi:membrane protein implicated in regulation of membrane protease activity